MGRYEVKEANERFAVIAIHGPFPLGILTLTAQDNEQV